MKEGLGARRLPDTCQPISLSLLQPCTLHHSETIISQNVTSMILRLVLHVLCIRIKEITWRKIESIFGLHGQETDITRGDQE